MTVLYLNTYQLETNMKVLDLFSGIGGFALGLDRAGMETVAFCEIDEAAKKVLAHRFPTIPIFEDVSTLTKEALDNHGITVDVIVGGFPCQDISFAGHGAGLAGERSGLWFEFHRLIQEIKPKYIIAENVAALRSRGLDEVLRSLSEIGYDAEWHCIPASAVGAPHQRDRIWIVAYPNIHSDSPEERGSDRSQDGVSQVGGSIHSSSRQSSGTGDLLGGDTLCGHTASHEMAYANGSGLQGGAEAGNPSRLWSHLNEQLARCRESDRTWAVEPAVGRVANGIPNRSHRIKQLGNAVVPKIPEIIGKAIMEKHYDQRT